MGGSAPRRTGAASLARMGFPVSDPRTTPTLPAPAREPLLVRSGIHLDATNVVLRLRCGLLPYTQRVCIPLAHESSTIAAFAAINLWTWRAAWGEA